MRSSISMCGPYSFQEDVFGFRVHFDKHDRNPRIWCLDHEAMFSTLRRINANEHLSLVGYVYGPKLRENELNIHGLPMRSYFSCSGEVESKEEDGEVEANKSSERQSPSQDKDYKEPPPAHLFEPGELTSWSFYRAGISEFVATFLFLYITVLTMMGVVKSESQCSTVGIQGVAWAFGGMIFALVYCTAGISGGYINPAVTFGLFLARKLSLARTVFYIVMQTLGAICGAGVVKGFDNTLYQHNGGGTNIVGHDYTLGAGLGSEIIGTFVLVYTVFSSTDTKRSSRDPHVPILAPLPIGFAYFLVHLATIPITGTGLNPARSLGAAIIYNEPQAWDHFWIFWVGPFIGAALAAAYQVVVIRGGGGNSDYMAKSAIGFKLISGDADDQDSTST